MKMTPVVRHAIDLLRQESVLQGDAHFDDHLIEFRNDGWTVQHPVIERIDGTLFDCRFANWDMGDIGLRGRFVLVENELGELCIGDKVEP